MLRAGPCLWARARHALSRPLNAASGSFPAPPSVLAAFTTSAPRDAKPMPARPKPPPEDEIEEFYLKGSGPGGQKINKTSSAVQLRHVPTGIVVKSQATRSREQNRKIARELLAARVDELRNGDCSRSALVADIKRRRAASAAKKSRRKYRKVEGGEKGSQEGGETLEQEEGEQPAAGANRDTGEAAIGEVEDGRAAAKGQ